MKTIGLALLVTLALSPAARADALCDALAFAPCGGGRTIVSTRDLPEYRLNTAAFANEL